MENTAIDLTELNCMWERLREELALPSKSHVLTTDRGYARMVREAGHPTTFDGTIMGLKVEIVDFLNGETYAVGTKEAVEALLRVRENYGRGTAAVMFKAMCTKEETQ